jgi:hypothetical protein
MTESKIFLINDTQNQHDAAAQCNCDESKNAPLVCDVPCFAGMPPLEVFLVAGVQTNNLKNILMHMTNLMIDIINDLGINYFEMKLIIKSNNINCEHILNVLNFFHTIICDVSNIVDYFNGIKNLLSETLTILKFQHITKSLINDITIRHNIIKHICDKLKKYIIPNVKYMTDDYVTNLINNFRYIIIREMRLSIQDIKNCVNKQNNISNNNTEEEYYIKYITTYGLNKLQSMPENYKTSSFYTKLIKIYTWDVLSHISDIFKTDVFFIDIIKRDYSLYSTLPSQYKTRIVINAFEKN